MNNLQQLSFNNISDWPTGIKWLVVGFCGFFILLIGYWLTIKDISKNLSLAQQQYVIQKQTLFTRKRAVKNLPLLQKQVQALRIALAAQINNDNVDVITEIGAQVGVHFTSIKLLPEKTAANFIESPVQLSLLDDYQHAQQFVAKLVAVKTALGIKSFIINDHDVNFIINIYRLLQAKKTIANNRAGRSAVVNQRDPFHTVHTNTLETFPLHALHMVGVVQQTQKIWALLIAPDGRIYPVTIGTHLDTAGQVVQVDAEKVVIIKDNRTIILRLISAGKA